MLNLFHRLFLNLRRNPAKSLLLLSTFFILGIVVSGAISVQQAIQNVEASIRQEIPPIVSIETDYDAVSARANATGEWPEIDGLTLEILSEIGALMHVNSYDVAVISGLQSAELKRYVSNEELNLLDGMGDWQGFGLRGVHNSRLVDIEEGIIELISGRMFSNEEVSNLVYVALISEEVAYLNNLNIGSVFTLDDVIWDMRGVAQIDSHFYTKENIYAQRSHDFEVVGIFRSLVQFATGDEWSDAFMRDEHLNRIYVPNPVAIAAHGYQMEYAQHLEPDAKWFQESPEDSMWLQSVYVLDATGDIEDFRVAAEGILPDFWVVVGLDDSFEGIVGPMDNLRSLADAILLFAAGASILILGLLSALFVRERKREIGIYLAIGEKRRRVAMQVVLEILVLAFVGIVLSLLVGNLLAGNISSAMLRNSMVAEQNMGVETNITFSNLGALGFVHAAPSAEEVLADYDVSLSSPVIISFLITSAGVIVAITIIPTLYILRLNPRKIMM